MQIRKSLDIISQGEGRHVPGPCPPPLWYAPVSIIKLKARTDGSETKSLVLDTELYEV